MLYDIHKVVLVIAQPCRDNFTTYEISIADLYDWAENILVERASTRMARVKENKYLAIGVNFVKLKHNAALRPMKGLKRQNTILLNRIY